MKMLMNILVSEQDNQRPSCNDNMLVDTGYPSPSFARIFAIGIRPKSKLIDHKKNVTNLLAQKFKRPNY